MVTRVCRRGHGYALILDAAIWGTVRFTAKASTKTPALVLTLIMPPTLVLILVLILTLTLTLTLTLGRVPAPTA